MATSNRASSPPSNSSLASSKRQKVKDDTKPRPYQLELLDAAINENTIVNLGTGAGKTFIAVMLIREYSYEILERFSEPDAKRTVFLVNTVPLVKQQAEYIENHSLLDVGKYVGSMNVDSWLRGKWQREFDEHHVLVMTHTIFRKCLESGFVHLRKINLLIFDECHHAVKNHEYVQIMKIFDSCQMDEHPRVLGLSASLIPSKCKQGDLERKIKDLEEILRCRAEAARDLEEVAKYATNPDEMIEYYRSSSEDAHIAELRRTLEGPVNFLEASKKQQKTGVYDKVKLYLDDCLHILENLGIWCAHDFAQGGLQKLMEDIAEMGEVLDDWEKSLMHLAVTHLQIFKQESEKKLDLYHSREFPSTSKVKKLFDHLAKYKGSDDARYAADPAAQRNLLGIVFVERRTTAVQLSKLLKHKKELNPTLKHIKCDYIVGHNEGRGGTHLRREAHMTIKKQEEVLKKFRKEKLNLVMATTVMEEGVDVPQCNLVVRFDFPQNFRSYIQSKGRARAKPSTYLILVQGDSRQMIQSQLCNYHVLEEDLKHLCHDRHAPEEEEVLKKMEDIVQPYMPYGREAGTRATLSSSLSLIHQYCQKLPSDRYTVLTPMFKTEKRHVELHRDRFGVYEMDDVEVQQEFEYRSHMMLPINCPVKEETIGLWMPTRRIAEKSAALEGVKKLHEAGGLNEHLKPVVKDILDSDEEDDVKVEESRINHAGTEKRGQYYPNEVAQCLSDCFPAVGPGNYLYAFIIQEEGSPGLYLDHPHIGQPTTLGLLTRKPLPNLRIPEFSLYEHENELHVSMKRFDWNKVNTICLTEEELIILSQCHKAIFTDILGIAGTYLQFGSERSTKNYLVVPLGILLPDMEHYLDMDLARKVAEMGSNPLASNQPLEWPCPLDVFINALVTGIHCPLSNQKLHKVCSIDESTTPLSPFPDPRYASFAEYFESKYNFRFSDLQQPALKCKQVSSGESRLRLLTSRFKSTQGEDVDRKTTRDDVVLFPECCSLYPLPANFWMLVRCLPSILWRVECTALVDVFRSTVASKTRIGFSSEGRECTTCTTLRGYQDYGFGDLKTQCFSTSSRGEEDAYILNSPTSTLRGPDNALLLQALTPKGASDSINLERLETLGDSFLKLATSVYLFCDLPQHTHEGNLSMARSRRVGNLNLYLLAKGKHIPGKVFSKGFEPKQMWIPPCTYFDTSDLSQATPEEMPPQDSKQCHYQYHKVTDKGVADCVESLLGAYLVSGGIESCLRFMKWMGIKINKKAQPQIAAMTSDDECMFQTSLSSSPSTPPKTKRPKTQNTPSFTPSDSVPLVIRASSAIFANHFGSPPSALFDPCKQKEVERLLKVSMGSLQPQLIQGVINWTFTDTSFLLQALTHASYTRNRVTDCYQRLEFLGDAVLDYLVTCYIYQTFPNFGPGEISGMRSALVNNNTFAELAVNLKLHKALLHNSPALFRQIPTYVEALNDKKAADRQAQEEEEEEEEGLGASVTVGTIKDQSDPTSEDDSLYEEELDPPKVLGDILESVAGAVFLDSGMNLNAVWSVFKHLFQKKIDEFGGKVPVLPVQELYEMEPNAKCTSTKLKRDRVLCTITVADKGIQVSANGRSHRAAKTAAARAMVGLCSQPPASPSFLGDQHSSYSQLQKQWLNQPLQRFPWHSPGFRQEHSEARLEVHSTQTLPFLDPPNQLQCTYSGCLYYNAKHGITLKVPEGAIPRESTVDIEVGVQLYGNFMFPPGMRPVSPIVWLCKHQEGDFEKDIEVTLPHFLSNPDGTLDAHLCFLKADHHDATVHGASLKYCFRTTQNRTDFGRAERQGILYTNHFCFVCIAKYGTRDNTLKETYCLTSAIPKPIARGCELYFYITYFLDTCLSELQKEIPPAYDLNHKSFVFSSTGSEAGIEVEAVQSHDAPQVALKCKKITASEVDFWKLHEDNELELRYRLKMYPPRFVAEIGELRSNSDYKVTMQFKGVSANLDMDVILPAANACAHPNSSLSSGTTNPAPMRRDLKPRMNQLYHLVIDGENVSVLKSIAPQWKNFGLLFDFDEAGETLDRIECEMIHSGPVACCHKMFQHWLDGNGSCQPATWGTLITLLKDDGYCHKADQLEKLMSDS